MVRSSLRHSLADGIRARIADGELRPGEQLPSEPDLARSLGVSRASMRAAITLLEEEGYLRRVHGSGTYVTSRSVANDLGRNYGVSSLIAATGLEPGTTDRESTTEPATAEVAVALGIETGTPVRALRRVRTAGGQRVVDSVDWCRSDDLSSADIAALGDGSLYDALAARGLAVHHGTARIVPDAADAATARRLRVPRGALLLTLFQVDETADGRPVLFSREHHLADAFEITVYRRGPGE